MFDDLGCEIMGFYIILHTQSDSISCRLRAESQKSQAWPRF